jgi:thiol-disulfide isomerase/thioredoxin
MKANLLLKTAPHGFGLAVVVLVLALGSGCATTQAPTAADERLTVPAAADERAYLGLAATNGEFDLEDIHCEILVVDCFDMYCHICQAGAPHLNELYRLTQEGGLGDRIKFIGIGVGDTPLEVTAYKQKLHVMFPVFPDRHTLIAKRFGPVRLPNLLVLRIRNGQWELIQSMTGPLLDPAGFLAHLQADLSAAGDLHSWSSIAQLAQPTCQADAADGRSGCPYLQNKAGKTSPHCFNNNQNCAD